MKPLDPRLLRYSRSSRGFLSLTVVIALITAGLTITQGFLLAHIVVAIFQRHSLFAGIKANFIALIIIFIAKAILSYFTEWLGAIASTRIRNELRIKLIAKSISHSSREINATGSAQLSVLATKGINSLDGYFAKFIPQLFIAACVPALVGITIAFQDLQAGLIILFTIPLIPIFGIFIGRYTAAANRDRWQSLGILSGYFADLLQGLRTLKVYGRDKLQSKKLAEVGDQYSDETMRVLKISFLSSLALELIATLSVALLAVSIGLRLVSGSISLSVGLFILICAPEVYWPIRQVASYFHAAADGVEAFQQIFSILDRVDTDQSENISTISAISWSELTVEYPGRTTIHIPAGQLHTGEFTALIGPSGSGKSTLAKILMGFLLPSSGEVIFTTERGNLSLQEIPLISLHQLISWLPQDPKFAMGTVRQALQVSAPRANDLQLIQTLHDAGLEISDLEQGLDTRLGNLQQALSVGQLRKIALTRAILKKSPVLIMDEPSASVDDLSEEVISALIQLEAAAGRMVLMISHRPQLTKSAGQIIDMAALR